MNARSLSLELDVEQRQVEEAVLSVFHSIIFHRSTGKFHYSKDDTYTIGTVGIRDIECDFIDFTYVRCNSETMDTCLKRDITAFCQAVKTPTLPSTGQITLEFYQRKKGRWPFSSDSTPWEVYNLKINIVNLSSENERQDWREKVGVKLGELLLQITDFVNRGDYTPAPPSETELDLVYDTTFPDVQPFLFKVAYSLTPSVNSSVSTTVKKLLRDTLSLT